MYVSPNELQYLRIEVDVQPSRLGMLYYQRRREASFGCLHGLAPGLVPHVLERHKRASDLFFTNHGVGIFRAAGWLTISR